MHGTPCPDCGGEAVTTDVKDEATESAQEAEKSFFARGALLGLVGGVVVAILLISVGGSVVSLVDDLFGSTEVEAAPAEELTGEALLIATGEDLATTNGCIGCHSINGLDGTGPTWSGLAATVDDEYLRRAILQPNADIAAGYTEGIMPVTYEDSLSTEDIDALVAYIQSL
jgi:cytochrome c oxidase subunit 2